VRYEDVPADEAIDLIESLPDGARWVAATYPLRSWALERHLAANVVDALGLIAYRIGAFDGAAEPPRVTRPRDVAARAEDAERARRVRSEVESDGWEEM